MLSHATVPQKAHNVVAIKYPVCSCGRPYTEHVPSGCTGYLPLGQVRKAAYTNEHSWACRIIFRLEQILESTRLRLE